MFAHAYLEPTPLYGRNVRDMSNEDLKTELCERQSQSAPLLEEIFIAFGTLFGQPIPGITVISNRVKLANIKREMRKRGIAA
jgi:hypothetical protein